MNATRSLHRGALCGDVRRWRKSGTNEPLRQTSIQTPGDRIFVGPVTDEGPHFEVGRVARWMGANHAELQDEGPPNRVGATELGSRRTALPRTSQARCLPTGDAGYLTM